MACLPADLGISEHYVKRSGAAASLSDANRELKSMVYRDSLTTLPNRLHFEEKIEELLQQGSDSFSVFLQILHALLSRTVLKVSSLKLPVITLAFVGSQLKNAEV